MPDGVERRALNLLRRMVGPTTEFRQHQLEAILALVRDRRRVLLVQRTGWGKSAVYVIATRLLRDDGAGPTLLVSPLLALMRNQIAMAERLGVRAASINSENRRDWEPILEELRRGEVDLLLISPERLNNPLFRREALPLVAAGTGLLVVDEIHCISDWGHDFRPDYRRLVRVLELLPRGIPVLGTTATANDRVVDDIHEQLGQDLLAIRGPLDRDSLSLAVLALPSQAERMAWLADHIPGLPGTGIVYCLTIGDTERLAEWLRSRGIPSVAYTGQSDAERRLEIERDLLENQVKVVVATSALGMGFDKPDLGFVVHFQAPGTPIAYYQQVGRAGRALADSVGLLLAGREDKDIQDWFISTAFPPREQAERVVAMLLEAGRSLSVADILAHENVRRTRLDAMLKILEVEGAVERSDGGWRRTLKPWSYDQERVERVTVERRAEQAAMLEYQRTDGCLMEFLRRRLDDPGAVPCGRCMNCTGRRPDPTVDRGLADAARTFLRSRDIELAPRLMWPPGLDTLRGRIDLELTLRPGRSLSVYNDGGWGELVRSGKQHDGFFSDELVEASMKLIRRWRPDPPPTWVTCVPSTSRPDLVPSFAERLAAALGLPFRAVVRKRQSAAPQKDMENSVQQLMNVRQAFEVEAGSVPEGPVLLLDDIVDSRWTMTVVGMELLRAGSGPVHPFVLAQAVST